MLRVVVVDSDIAALGGLLLKLSAVPDLDVSVVTRVEDIPSRPDGGLDADVVAIDLQTAGTSPAAPGSVRALAVHRPVLVVSAVPNSADVLMAVRNGASGYLSKDSSAERFAQAIGVVADGGFFLSPDTAALIHSASAAPDDLTMREQEVLAYLAQGLTVQETARRIGVTAATVDTYITRVRHKLNLNSRKLVAVTDTNRVVVYPDTSHGGAEGAEGDGVENSASLPSPDGDRHPANDGDRALAAASPEWPVRWRLLPDGTLGVVLGPGLTDPPSFGPLIAVDSYLATDDPDIAAAVYGALDGIAAVLGYDTPEPYEHRRGSIFRRAKARFQQVLSSDELARRLVAVERALELRHIDNLQADVDSKEAEAVAGLLQSLEALPQACILIGSILLIKGTDSGGPFVLVRTLSPTEVSMFQRFPEIQMRPTEVLERLAMAVSADRGEVAADGS